uniref:C2H2-type domain-containing protein n=1 Tax=Anabas testudineus TaxID=64144 RepID=A0AAQ6IRW9_ANATE
SNDPEPRPRSEEPDSTLNQPRQPSKSSQEKLTVTADDGTVGGYVPELVHRCPRCGEAFGQASSLRLRHLRIHTGERPYSCPYCCRTFSDGDTMKKHKRTHSGEKPYRCGQCSKSFTSTSGLQIHLKKDMCYVANP